MPKIFYTEDEIEDLFKSGVTRLEINDNVQLTALAYEMANRLGMKLVENDNTEQIPAAPIRPYISKFQAPQAAPSAFFPKMPTTNYLASQPTSPRVAPQPDLFDRVKNAVLARLGGKVDQKLLDIIIRRILDQVKE